LPWGDYVVLLAVRLTPGALPELGSARLLGASRLPESVDFSDHWLEVPNGAVWDPSARTVTLPAIDHANLYRISFVNSVGSWEAYRIGALQAPTTVSIPMPPMGLTDVTEQSTVTVDAIEIDATVPPSSLFEFAADPLARDRATRGFARALIARN
jgi:hypothetical protein